MIFIISDPCHKGVKIPSKEGIWEDGICHCQFVIMAPFEWKQTLKVCEKHKKTGLSGRKLFKYVIKENQAINHKKCKEQGNKTINKPCVNCGYTELAFTTVGLTIELVCGNCGKMPYEKSDEDKKMENWIIDGLDEAGINHRWKRN